jgi:tetratricopeptide (TPR) repeat protein
LFELKKIKEAEKEYKTILKIFSTHVKAITGYAYLLTEYGYMKEAEEYYSRTLDVYSNYISARGGYEKLLQRQR